MEWLLPSGIEDLLPLQARQLERARQQTVETFDAWGYAHVIPPLVEYEDSLLPADGDDLARQTFRLVDPLTGGMLGIRADITPQIARIAARYFDLQRPVRLSYVGDTLQAKPSSLNLSRNPLQMGAELIGNSGSAGDVEIVRLMVESLRQLGVDGFTLALGHVGIFQALCEEAGLTNAQRATYKDILQRKALTEIDPFLAGIEVDGDYVGALRALVDLHGGPEVMGQASSCFNRCGSGVLEALQSLIGISDALMCHFPDQPFYFDLAELREYEYHSGLVFAAYLPGVGQAIASGGRYDEVATVFDSSFAATGFSADLKRLLECSRTLSSGDRETIIAPASCNTELALKISELRSGGARVVYELADQPLPAGVTSRIVELDGQWKVVPI